MNIVTLKHYTRRGYILKEVIKFTLKSKQAIIKKPESNLTYFTYNNPHKVMILGLLGAIIGENGYNYNLLKGKELELPEYYKNLEDLKIAIIPESQQFGKFNKKIQTFNNSVGYASKEEGGNLIVNEQWLEEPKWSIYILENESTKYQKIKDYLINSKCEYIPYIGKNDHFATICDVEILSLDESKNVTTINSLFINDENINIKDLNVISQYIFNENESEVKYEYREIMPTKLNEKVGYIDYKEFLFTNKSVDIKDMKDIYTVNNKNLYFF